MKIPFCKYEGTGNDFILIDNRSSAFASSVELIATLCHRRFGVGADGLILLELSQGCDFGMRYFNSDGREGSLCGNGGRCITAFAHSLGLIDHTATISASDGIHRSEIVTVSPEGVEAMVRLEMHPVVAIEQGTDFVYLDTGSPHYVVPVENLDTLDVFSEGRKIRYSERFSDKGTNVDFIKQMADGLAMRVYERGVEEETYSSGTGAVASAIAASLMGWTRKGDGTTIHTKGGKLNVGFETKETGFEKIWLEGPVNKVFKGELEI